jgi:hypothetical protein
MIYLHTKFRMSSSNTSLVIAVKPEAEEYFSMAAMLLRILYSTRNITLIKAIFFPKISYNCIISRW